MNGMGDINSLNSPAQALSNSAPAMLRGEVFAKDLSKTRTALPPALSSSADNPATFVINGRFLEQATTGVQRVAREVTKQIDRLVGAGELPTDIEILCSKAAATEGLALKHLRIKIVGPRHGVLWEQLDLPRFVGNRPLLCLGNTAPVRMVNDGRPVGMMLHDMSFYSYPNSYSLKYRLLHKLMLPRLLKGATHLFFVSKSEQRRVAEVRADILDRSSVHPNGGWGQHDNDEMPEGSGEEIKLPLDSYMLFVGSLSRRKNIEAIVRAAVEIAETEGVPTVIIGSSAQIFRTPDLTIPAHLKDKIIFFGQINDSRRLATIYQRARLLLFPTLYEASALPPLEAAHFGCPVLASNIPSMWERCEDGVFYCDPLCERSIVDKLRQMLADPEECKRKAAILAVRERNSSWEQQARSVAATMLAMSGTR